MTDVSIEFGAKIDKLIAATETVSDKLDGLVKHGERLTSKFTELGKVLVEAFAAERIVHFVDTMAELGEKTESLADRLGLTVDKMVQLQGIARLSGTDIDGMVQSIERLSLNVQRSTRDAFDPAAQGLKVLGLNAKDLIGLDADKYFDRLAEAVSKFNPSLNLTNALMAVGGRGVAQLVPALLQGAEGFRKWREDLAKAQDGLAQAIPGMADTHQKLTLLSLSTQSLGARIFTVLKPAIDLIITAMTTWIQALDYKTIQTFANTLIDVLGSAIIKLIGIFYELGGTLDTIFTKLQRILLGAALGGTLGLFGGPAAAIGGAILGGGVVAAWDHFIGDFSAGADKAKDATKKEQDELVGRIKEMMKSISDAIAGGKHDDGHGDAGKGDAGAINAGARQAIEVLAARYQAEISLLQESLNQKKVLYDLDASLYKITDDQKFALTMAATQREFEQEQIKLQKIRDLWPAHSKEWENVQLQMTQAVARNTTEMVRLNAQSVQSMASKWDEVFGAMQSSFNGTLRGLLAGTTSWKQAFKTVLGDMLIYFIEMVEKMAFKWLAGQIAQVAATQTAESAKAAAATAGEAALLPLKIARFTSDITADAALVFGGIFAQLAPLLGPAAAGPAAAGEASVLAQLAAVPKFETGTDYVPQTGLAIVHEGERIIPAAQNKGGQGAMSPSFVFPITAWDGQSVARWLQAGGADLLAKAVSTKITRNPSLRPGY